MKKSTVKFSLFTILIVLFLVGCDSKPTRPMVVSTNLWIVNLKPLFDIDK